MRSFSQWERVYGVGCSSRRDRAKKELYSCATARALGRQRGRQLDVALLRQRPDKSFADAQPRLQEKGIIVGNRLLDKGFHLPPSLGQACFSCRLLRGILYLFYPPLPCLELTDLFELYLQEFRERLDNPFMHALG